MTPRARRACGAIAAFLAVAAPPAAAPGDGTVTAPEAERAAPPRADAEKTPAAEVSWDRMRPYLAAGIGVVRVDVRRWSFLPLAPEPGHEGGPDAGLQRAALEILDAARDDVAWIIAEVTEKRLFHPFREVPVGATARLLPTYIPALFEDPAFTDPLRRFADAVLRARGAGCRDCLEGVRAARDVTWAEVTYFLTGFIHVKSVEERRVDLQVASIDNHLTEFSRLDQALGAAVYAAMHAASRGSPSFPKAVSGALNELLLGLPEEMPDEEIRAHLNRTLAERVLADPEARRPLLERLPDALERHGLRCTDCPRPGR